MKRHLLVSRRPARQRSFRPALLALEDRALLSTGGYGSGSGGASLPSGLGADINFINNPTDVAIRDFQWEMLVLSGGAPWKVLQPTDFSTQNPPDKTDVLSYGALTRTIVTHFSATGSSSGGDGGSWQASYVERILITTTSSDVDSSGHNFDQTSSHSYDLSWDGSGDSSGTATYKVKEDISDTGSVDATGGSYNRHQGSYFESHLTAQGTEDNTGTITGGFTFKGSMGSSLNFNDASGDPASSGSGYTLNYTTSNDEKLNESGNLVPDSSNQSSCDVKDSESGTIATFDGNGELDGVTRDDFNEVQSNYDGSGNASPGGPGAGGSATANAAAPNAGPPATQGPVDVNGPLTELNVPKGKAVAYIIDLNDTGWDDWTEADRARYRQDHNIPADAQNVIGSGAKIKAALSPLQGPVFGASSLDQITKDLAAATLNFGGKLDVLVIGDHGKAGAQQLGSPNAPYVTPVLLKTPTAADQLVAFIKPGGTLIVTGCNVLAEGTVNADGTMAGQQTLNDWQAYATARGITIMGSVSYTAAKRPDVFRGIWVTLVPGGTAPQLVSN